MQWPMACGMHIKCNAKTLITLIAFSRKILKCICPDNCTSGVQVWGPDVGGGALIERRGGSTLLTASDQVRPGIQSEFRGEVY